MEQVQQGAIEDIFNNVAISQILDDEFKALADKNILDVVDGNNRNDGDENPDGIRLIRLPPLINKAKFLTSVRTLNVKQRIYLHHLLQNVINNI